jgi:hypothetical protein
MALTKPQIARLISAKVDTTKEILVQFFHSTFYKPDSNDYVSDFIAFETELDEFREECKDWSLDKTFLKGKVSEPLKIPKKVLKQMMDDYLETQAYIAEVIRQINED